MKSKYLHLSERNLLVYLAVVTMLGPFAVDAYLPMLPQMAHDLNASDATIQLTVSVFFFGSIIGSIIFGPVSDAVGRRLVLCWGLCAFAVFSLGCAVSSNASWLLFFRFLQAVAGSSSMIAGRALLADLYSGDELARKTSTIMMAMSVAPMIAPIIGGWAGANWGWQVIFWGLSVAAVVAMIFSFARLPETLEENNRSSLAIGQTLKAYWGIATHPIAVTYSLAGAGITALFFSYVAASPFLYIEYFGLSITAYSGMFATGAALAMAANVVNIWSVGRWGFQNVLLILGLLAMALGVLLILGAFGLFGRWSIYASGLLFMPIFHLITTNALTGVMGQFDARKGTASAFYTTVRFSGAMLGPIIIGWAGATEPLLYGLILFVFSAFAGVAAQMAVRWDKAAS